MSSRAVLSCSHMVLLSLLRGLDGSIRCPRFVPGSWFKTNTCLWLHKSQVSGATPALYAALVKGHTTSSYHFPQEIKHSPLHKHFWEQKYPEEREFQKTLNLYKDKFLVKYAQMPLEKFPGAVITNKAYFTPLRPTELMQSLCSLHNAGKKPPPPCSGRAKLTC